MKINNCSTALFIKDIEVSKLFYTKVLNLNIDLDFGKNIIFKEGFAIWEIQQNHIEIGESLKVFITRFYNQGLSVEQVSVKTSVPVEEVERLIDK
jgi:hypothetical protein